MRRAAIHLLLRLLGLLALLHGLAADAAAARPNVILILADDLGWGDLGAHGHPRLQTPNLDRLRQQSTRLTDFHVAPMCTPTRGELMTGIAAYRNGATSVASGGTAVRRELALMPQFFKDGGYATAHFGKWHLGDHYPYRAHDRGFDLSLGYKGFGIDSIAGEWGNDAFDDRYWRNDRLTRIRGYNTDVFFTEAMRWIGRQTNKPFFVYLAPTASHEPFYVESRYAKPYEDLRGQLPAFFGMTANLDENIGRLMRFLDRRGLAANTLLIYLSDNGTVERTGFYSAGLRGRKTSLYDGGHRVPLFIRWPRGLAAGARDIDALAHGTDLLPTLIDLLGLPNRRAQDFDGSSLGPWLRGSAEAPPDRKLVVQYGHMGPAFIEWDSAVMWHKWRLVKGRELYDVASDPGQQTDLAAQRPEIVRALREHYEEWAAATRPLLDPVRPVLVGSKGEPITRLTSADWLGPYAGDLGELGRLDQRLFGAWTIEAATAGEYEVSLHLFPPESETPLNRPLRGVPARPVAAARLLVDGQASTLATAPTATHASFRIRLARGEQRRLEGQFLGSDGAALCGAFFVRVRWLRR